MKKVVSSKTRNIAGNREERTPQVDVKNMKMLHTVSDREAFYFYEAVGKPTGEVARSLTEFLDKVKTVKSESLMFHMQRGDFHNWIENTLDDSALARKLRRISPSRSNDVRSSICKAVEARINELKESPIEILVGEDQPVILSAS